MAGNKVEVEIASGPVFNNPKYGEQLLIKDNTNHQSVYECLVNKQTIKKVINGRPNYKIKLGKFNVKYPRDQHLLTLNLFIQPNGNLISHRGFKCNFQMQFQCNKFPTHAVFGLVINYIIDSIDLGIDYWGMNKFSASDKVGYSMTHKSFQMSRFKQWWQHNATTDKNGIIFRLIIKNIQLINTRYQTVNHSKIVTFSRFNYKKRYFKFNWTIDRNTILKFKQYKISQWFRSSIKDQEWYFVLYPMGDTEIEDAKPDCVQFAIDLVTTPQNIYGFHVCFNAVLMETYTHFHSLNCYYEAKQTGMSQAADVYNSLKCKDLFKLNSITFEVELYVFRPRLQDHNELFVNYWDIHCDKYKIKTNPPLKHKMKGNYEWEICNNHQSKFDIFDCFVTAKNNEKMLSNMFEIGYLKWTLFVFPNGEFMDEYGWVKLSLFFADTMPTNLSLIVLKYQFYCPQFEIFQSGIFPYQHAHCRKNSILLPRWQIGMLNLNEVAMKCKDKKLTLGVNVEIMRVKNLKQQIIYDNKFQLKLSTQITLILDSKNWVQSLYKYKDTVFDNIWCILYTPHVTHIAKTEGAISLMLHSMPCGIAKIKTNYTCSFLGKRFTVTTDLFSYQHAGFGGKFIDGENIKQEIALSSVRKFEMCFTVDIIELLDMNGNVMAPNSIVSSQINRFAMYLWKIQRNYVDALFFFRKSFYCQRKYANDNIYQTVNERLYKRLRSKLLKKICKMQCSGSAVSGKHIDCGNVFCLRSHSNYDRFMFRKCKGCKSIYYCSRSCQKLHWHYYHRRYCL